MPTLERSTYMQSYREQQRRSGVRRVNVTLTANEYAQMQHSATTHGERLTTHLKTRAFAHLETRYLVPPDIAERLDGVLAILRGIGNNLNQLARHANEMRAFLDTDDVRAQLKRMEGEIRAFVTEPKRPDE